MSRFEDFESTYGPPASCERPGDDVVRGYESDLPPQLLDHWREVGWCSYGDGLLWFTDPAQLEDIVTDWLGFESGRVVAFLRTAFAHLYLWHGGYAYSFDPHRGELSRVTDDIELLFTLLCDEDIQAKILRLPLYREVEERLGPPERDECYAFVPALALGGPGTADTVERVKLREHLGILAEIHGG